MTYTNHSAPCVRKRLYYLIIITLVLFGIFILSLSGITKSKPTGLELSDKLEPQNLPQLELIKGDFGHKLFNLTFRYIISPSPCTDILAIIIVTSYFANVETRSAMRRAFSQNNLQDLGFKRVFLLGESKKNAYVTQESILDENKRFGDIIQGNFEEAYRNLTYKHIMGHKWVSEECRTAKHVIKMDDDIVVNLVRVAELIRNISLSENAVAGYVLRNMAPIREPQNKWYVTKQEYYQSKYPPFVSGWFYITTPKLAAKFYLLAQSHRFDYFWIDDVYVTGILAKSLKVKLHDLHEYFTVFPELLQCCIRDIKKRVECDILVGPNGGDNNLFYKFNQAMNICRVYKCTKRVKPINETCVAERQVNLGKGNAVIEKYNLH